MVLARAKKFGSSSEKRPIGQLSLELFDEAEKESNLNAAEPTIEKIIKKKRKSRTENISNLETEITEYTLSDSELTCPNCNTPLKKMSEESRETIKLYKKVIRSIEKRNIYSCPKCGLVVKAPMPKSKYGKALKYASNQLPNVMHYLEKAELDIDNNLAERSIKPFVIGRKNWLFSNTAHGADASSRLYSIVQTCILNNINPYEYLDYVLDKLANMTINHDTDIDSLLPWNYSKN